MAIKTFEIELDLPIQPVCLEEGYNIYRALIRFKNQPIGWISFTRQAGNDSVSACEIREMIQKQLDNVIIHQALLSSFKRDDVFDKNEGISVIVCTRNRVEQLALCIQSLLSIDYDLYEIIIVDNAPNNDEAYQLIRNLPVCYVREDRPGLDWARNRGIAKAKYPLVAFTDDDVRVDPYWLKAIAKTFMDKEVVAVSGYVAPAELDSHAQWIFELQYGGMGHGFHQRLFRKEGLSEKHLLWASRFGVGANMAFRKEVFDKIGAFDTALDVGTPSNGGGDIEMFHRLISNNYVMAYEPSMLVYHYHRKEYPALRKQLFDNGRSFGCYLINCYRKRTVNRVHIIRFLIMNWLLQWNLKNLLGRHRKVPRLLSLVELAGMASSPYAYVRTKFRDRKVRQSNNNRQEDASLRFI